MGCSAYFEEVAVNAHDNDDDATQIPKGRGGKCQNNYIYSSLIEMGNGYGDVPPQITIWCTTKNK